MSRARFPASGGPRGPDHYGDAVRDLFRQPPVGSGEDSARPPSSASPPSNAFSRSPRTESTPDRAGRPGAAARLCADVTRRSAPPSLLEQAGWYAMGRPSRPVRSGASRKAVAAPPPFGPPRDWTEWPAPAQRPACSPASRRRWPAPIPSAWRRRGSPRGSGSGARTSRAPRRRPRGGRPRVPCCRPGGQATTSPLPRRRSRRTGTAGRWKGGHLRLDGRRPGARVGVAPPQGKSRSRQSVLAGRPWLGCPRRRCRGPPRRANEGTAWSWPAADWNSAGSAPERRVRHDIPVTRSRSTGERSGNRRTVAPRASAPSAGTVGGADRPQHPGDLGQTSVSSGSKPVSGTTELRTSRSTRGARRRIPPGDVGAVGDAVERPRSAPSAARSP